MATTTVADCTINVIPENDTSCTFCGETIADWIVCACHVSRGRGNKCPNVRVKRNMRAPAAVLLISVVDFREPAHHLMNTVVGTLKGGDVDVYLWQMTVVEAMENNVEYYLWLTSLPPHVVLHVFLVTETVFNGGWVTSTDRSLWWLPEVELLDLVFNRDPEWSACYERLRHIYLYIVSCGGNFIPSHREPSIPHQISNWLSKTQVFDHILAFLNPRLIINEVQGFFTMLLTELNVHHTKFSEALVQAYCRDEAVQAHTDLLWFTGGHPPMILRDSSGSKVAGMSPPNLCRAGCPAGGASRVKIGKGKELIWKTQCCRVKYRLDLPEHTVLPVEQQIGARSYILVEWPGVLGYTLTKVE
ncbi:hypothetical protein RSOLAG22IIIB_12311 [Rhizoctonia solani]|uniref:Uncharacterized protein n=1 Tax=Rhizoctonia solani TaxID=456999 RepID=A0A0K6GDC7_9AGAM|nr:hypothetical protein RSOLAG22IIIB_12311 [Rhizoctonia solani]